MTKTFLLISRVEFTSESNLNCLRCKIKNKIEKRSEMTARLSSVKGQQIFVAYFFSSERMAAEVISEKKKVIVSTVPRMVSPRAESELIYKGK